MLIGMRAQPEPLHDLFRALADPSRRAILESLLHEGELTQRELRPRFEMSQPALSQHLRNLRDAGLIEARRDGRSTYYRLAPEALAPLGDWLAPFARFWTARLEALENLGRLDVETR